MPNPQQMNQLNPVGFPANASGAAVQAKYPVTIERRGIDLTIGVQSRSQVARRWFQVSDPGASAGVAHAPGWLAGPRIDSHDGAGVRTIHHLSPRPRQQMLSI